MFYYIGVSATREETGRRKTERQKNLQKKKVSRKIYMMKEREE